MGTSKRRAVKQRDDVGPRPSRGAGGDHEGRLRQLFDSIELGLAECEAVRSATGAVVDCRFVSTNAAFRRLTGLPEGAVDELLASEMLPDLDPFFLDYAARVVDTQRVERLEQYNGALERWYLATIHPGDGDRFAILCDDITERKRTERRQKILAEISKEFLTLNGSAGAVERMGQRIGQHFGVTHCILTEFVDETQTSVAMYGWNAAGVPTLTGTYRARDVFSEGELAARADGQSSVVNDTRSDSRPTVARYAARGIRSLVIVPVVRDGCWRSQLAILDDKPRMWQDDEIQLLREITDRLWARLERLRTEMALREAQRRLDDALTISRMAYWVWDPVADVTVGSKSMDDLFGLRDGVAFGGKEQRFKLVHPQDRDAYRATVLRATESGGGWQAEFRIVRPRDGRIAWLEERATVARDPASGRLSRTGLVWDITDRKRVEAAAVLERELQQRESLRRELAAAEEAERRRLAREVHDSFAQHLTALTLGTAQTRRMLDARESVEERLKQLEEMARALMSDARHLALELRPPELDDVGLDSALHTYAEQWSARYGVTADLAVIGVFDVTFPSEMGTAVYRIVQEALTNVARHAGARQVSVLLEKSGPEVRLIIEDDGRGFDLVGVMSQKAAEGRLGLAGMRERAALVGGTLEIESVAGQGTTVYVRIPYDRGSRP